MKFTNKNTKDIKQAWNLLGSKYASDVNKMVQFGETNGWENWKGEEPKDEREYLADAVYQLLKEANKNNTITQFRDDFPPAHTPFIKFIQDKGQSVEQLHFINEQKIVFLIGTAYQKRQAYILKDDTIIELKTSINAIGKSKQNNVFAIASNNTIVTTQCCYPYCLHGKKQVIIISSPRLATSEIGPPVTFYRSQSGPYPVPQYV